MIKKDFTRVKEALTKAKTRYELNWALGYEEALNNFGLLTRNQHYELFDNIWAKLHK